jgi:hypothetical protein
MKTYRFGRFENVLGNILYVIQRKTILGWFTVHEFDDRETMKDVAKQLKEKGNIVYEV